MSAKFYIVFLFLYFAFDSKFSPAAMWYDDVPLQERLDTVRAARGMFFELDDIYRSYKRDFARKDKKQIELDKKKISIIHDKLYKLPPQKGGVGDIDIDCRDVYGSIYVWVTAITGGKTYTSLPKSLTESEDFKKNQPKKDEEEFLITNARCINLMNEKEESFLKQLGKK